MAGKTQNMSFQIGWATMCRLLLNTARRFAYPFAPELSRGLGVPLAAVTSMIAANGATGIIGLLFGPVADRIGYRRVMMLGMGFMAGGMLAAGAAATYAFVLAGLLMAGFGKSAFDPAIQAYVSERVPFYRRGLAIGVMEFAWAGSALLAIPFLALLIDLYGWRAPFWALGVLGVVGLASLGIMIPSDTPTDAAPSRKGGFGNSWKGLLRRRPAMGMLLFAFLMSAGNDALFVVYGAWLEQAFGMGVLFIGGATGVIGAAELLGEMGSAFFADRFGLKRSVVFGLVLSVAAYAVLPMASGTAAHALAGLFLIFSAFEFTIVGGISLSTEILPECRATMMAGFFAAAGLGRILGALCGGPIWMWGRLQAVAWFSSGLSVLAILCLLWGLARWDGAVRGGPTSGRTPLQL
jgi:DHA1 family inner membrane transport protein